MISGVPSTPLGSTDLGQDRDLHSQPCTLHAWCTRTLGHPKCCWVKLRSGHAPADFGPGRQQLAGRAVLALDEHRGSAPAVAESFATGHATASGAAPVPAEANAGGAGASNAGGAVAVSKHAQADMAAADALCREVLKGDDLQHELDLADAVIAAHDNWAEVRQRLDEDQSPDMSEAGFAIEAEAVASLGALTKARDALQAFRDAAAIREALSQRTDAKIVNREQVAEWVDGLPERS